MRKKIQIITHKKPKHKLIYTKELHNFCLVLCKNRDNEISLLNIQTHKLLIAFTRADLGFQLVQKKKLLHFAVVIDASR